MKKIGKSKIDIECIIRQMNAFYGKLNPNDENHYFRYDQDNNLSLVDSHYGIPAEYGAGLYYSIYGMIYRKHVIDTNKKTEHLEDIRVSPIVLMPYEVVEYSSDDGETSGQQHIEEFKAIALINTKSDNYRMQEVLIPVEAFSSKKATKIFFKSISSSSGWINLEVTKDLLTCIEKRMQYVFESIGQRIMGVTSLGMHLYSNPGKKYKEEWVWVGSKVSIDRYDNQIDTIRGLSHLIATTDHKLTEAKKMDISTELPKKLIENIFQFNHPGVTGIVLGISTAYFLKEKLWKYYNIKFPHFSIIGLSGSGKTGTLENIICPLLGMEATNSTIAAMVTKFALAKLLGCHNTLPVVITEYKPDTMTARTLAIIDSLINNAWDRAAFHRGRPTMGLDQFQLLSSTIILGEHMEVDQSKRERMVQIQTDHKNMNEAAMKICCENRELLTSIGKKLMLTSMGLYPEVIKQMFDDNRKYLSEYPLPPRPTDNILFVLVGLDLFGLVTGIQVGPYKLAATERFIKDTMQGLSSSVNAVEKTFQEISLGFETKDIPSRYKFIENDYLYLYILGIFPELEKNIKTRGGKIILKKTNFESQAIGLGYVTKFRKRFPELGMKSCLRINLIELSLLADSKDLDFAGLGVFTQDDYEKCEREAIEDGTI